jgi:hypoxanthine-guanine phosphoribosyltransferase
MSDKIIKVIDKEFEIFIPFKEIDNAIQGVANQINKDYKNKKPLFVVILNGAFMFAADLFKKLTIECEVSFVKLSSYQGTKTTEKVKKIIGLKPVPFPSNLQMIYDTNENLKKVTYDIVRNNRSLLTN